MCCPREKKRVEQLWLSHFQFYSVDQTCKANTVCLDQLLEIAPNTCSVSCLSAICWAIVTNCCKRECDLSITKHNNWPNVSVWENSNTQRKSPPSWIWSCHAPFFSAILSVGLLVKFTSAARCFSKHPRLYTRKLICIIVSWHENWWIRINLSLFPASMRETRCKHRQRNTNRKMMQPQHETEKCTARRMDDKSYGCV